MVLWSLFLCSACHSTKDDVKREVDRLNHVSYISRYKDLGVLANATDSALLLSEKYNYKKGKCYALCNKAFFSIARMDYDRADSILQKADEISSDNLQKLTVEVLYMRLCQRRSLNKDFYVHEFNAEKQIRRIHNKYKRLTDNQRYRFSSLKIEYAIVLSAYLYYVDRQEESSDALLGVANDKDVMLQADTAQWLAYLYNVGSGGIIKGDDTEKIQLQEYRHLLQCYMIASHGGYEFWEANALQAISEHIMDSVRLDVVKREEDASLRYLNKYNKDESLLANQLAERALNIFARYGDIYQTAGAWRTLANSYFHLNDMTAMLNCLLSALSDSVTQQAPNLIESINERLCIAYSSMDDKEMSDISRNEYLDMQDVTRQDRELEARTETMVQEIYWLKLLFVTILILLILSGVVVTVLIWYRRKYGLGGRLLKLTEQLESVKEECDVMTLQIGDARRISIEEHAKITLIQTLQPLIDRMAKVSARCETEESSREYIAELCETISKTNNLLTKWIQLRKGSVKLKIEIFPVQELLDIIRLNSVSFARKGVELEVSTSDIYLKADRVLTLFLLSTIVDNARKHTADGGRVTVKCRMSDVDGYADISVIDTGKGMTANEVTHLFDYHDIENSTENLNEQKSHGFGLMNCIGIIDRYRKFSSLFSKVDIVAESRVGEGTTIRFRLPYVVRNVMTVLLLLSSMVSTFASSRDAMLTKANAFADSMYSCNVERRYSDALSYSDSCRHYLNVYYNLLCKGGIDTLASKGKSGDLIWYDENFEVDYGLVLAMRNEAAVAALGLHRWDVFEYNNDIYTSLYRKCSGDSSLNLYFRKMERYQQAIWLSVGLLLLLIIGLIVVFYRYFVKDLQYAKSGLKKNIAEENDMLQLLKSEYERLYVSNSIAENCLSSIKHETMYYPSRISQLISVGNYGQNMKDTISYYRSLYVLLSSYCQRVVLDTPLQVQSIGWKELKNALKPYTEISCEDKVFDDYKILGHLELLRYLFLILKRKNSGKVDIESLETETREGYMKLTVRCDDIQMTEEQRRQLFNMNTIDVDYLIIKQILREIGDRTLRYGVGVNAGNVSGTTCFYISLPIKR